MGLSAVRLLPTTETPRVHLDLCLAWAVTISCYGDDDLSGFVARFHDGACGQEKHQFKSVSLQLSHSSSVAVLLADIERQLHPSINGTHNDALRPTQLDSLFMLPTQDFGSAESSSANTEQDSALKLDVSWTDQHNALRLELHNCRPQSSNWLTERILDQLCHSFKHVETRDTLSAAFEPACEHTTILEAWSKEPIWDDNATVTSLFEQRVHDNPGAPAVAAWDLCLTFEELNLLSARLARRLGRLGVQKGQNVPCMFERSGWTVVAALGVMRAGAAVVLFETSFPNERLQSMITDVEASVAVCADSLVSRMSSLIPNVVALQSLSHQEDDVNIQLPIMDPHDVAYVAFTSGSTGRPKGVSNEHGGICTSMFSSGRAYHTSSESRMLQGASYAFDAAVMEMVNTWIHGACICVPSERAKQQDLIEVINEFRITLIFVTPAVLRLMDATRKPPSLNVIMVGGEHVGKQDIQAWCDKLHIGVLYGPAECAALTSAHPHMRYDDDPTDLGRPEWCRCWIVDPDDPSRLMPVGALGELVIEGRIVGRGYIKRPELTDKTFIKDAPQWRKGYGSMPHRMYRTGDLVRWTENGSMQIAGRKDHQIKLHGQRIELGEIEQTIANQMPASHDVVVLVVGGKEGQPKNLAALLFAPGWKGDMPDGLLIRDGEQTGAFEGTRDGLHSTLSAKLPKAMVPTLWIPLGQSIPLNPNGKRDRRFLTSLVERLSVSERRSYAIKHVQGTFALASDTPHGKQLKSFVAAVLGGSPDEIDLNESLLALGGDSLSAMKISGLARRSNLDINPIDILQADRLGDLRPKTNSLDGNAVHRPTSFPIMHPEDLKNKPLGAVVEILPATQLQELFMGLPYEYFRYDIRGALDAEKLAEAWRRLSDRHSMMRTVLDRDRMHGRLFQVILADQDLELNVIRSNTPTDVKSSAQALFDSECASGPPMPALGTLGIRGHLFTDPSTETHIILLRMCHAHYDGVAAGILWDDFKALYEGTSLAATVPSFADYVSHCEVHASDAAFEFWRDALHDSQMTYLTGAPLPSTADKVVQATAAVAAPSIAGITTATLVKTAWSLSLSEHVKSSDVVFGQIVSGRSGVIPDSEAVMGPCMNTIPVRVTLNSHTSALALLHAVQAQHFASLRYETLDFASIRRRSTAWADDTEFGSLVLHQNMIPDPSVSIGDAKGVRTELYPEETTNEFILYSVPVSNGELELRLAMSRLVLQQSDAEKLVHATKDWIEALAGCGDESLGALGWAI